MARMIDAWHDRYHGEGGTFDPNCPHCQDEFMANYVCREGHPVGMCSQCDTATNPWYDRLEEMEPQS